MRWRFYFHISSLIGHLISDLFPQSCRARPHFHLYREISRISQKHINVKIALSGVPEYLGTHSCRTTIRKFYRYRHPNNCYYLFLRKILYNLLSSVCLDDFFIQVFTGVCEIFSFPLRFSHGAPHP